MSSPNVCASKEQVTEAGLPPLLRGRRRDVQEHNFVKEDWDLQTFWQGASIGEGDGFAELPGHAGHRWVKAKALPDAHGAVSHPAQVLPAGTEAG